MQSNLLSINPDEELKRITSLIADSVADLRRDGAVIAFSGGLDSATAAACTIRALGPDRVTLLYFPDRDSHPLHKKHAAAFASKLGVPLVSHRITSAVWALGAYSLMPFGFVPFRKLREQAVRFVYKRKLSLSESDLIFERMNVTAGSWVARGNAYASAKHRVRMLLVYQYADVHNRAVIGAANLTEWLTGSFSQWGVDHCADIMPLLHLFRTQVEQLAAAIGVPDYILHKAADPDLVPGVPEKGEMLGGFEKIDAILYGLRVNVSTEILAEKYGVEVVTAVSRLVAASQRMRTIPRSLLAQ